MPLASPSKRLLSRQLAAEISASIISFNTTATMVSMASLKLSSPTRERKYSMDIEPRHSGTPRLLPIGSVPEEFLRELPKLIGMCTLMVR